MAPGGPAPADDLDPEAQVIDDEPDFGCYVVEHPWVPILTEPSHEGKEVGRLVRGDLVCCEKAAADGRSTWVRLPPATEIFNISLSRRRRRRAVEAGGSGSECSDEAESGACAEESEAEDDEDDVPLKVRKSGEGGFVVSQHCFLGALLRHVGPPLSADESAALDIPRGLSQKEIDEVVSSTKNNEELDEEVNLPPESKIWSKEQLEEFLVHGTRPRWRFVPERRDLGLVGTMGTEQVEEVLRTAVEWISRADALIVCCGAGMAADSGLPTLQSSSRGPQAWKGLRKHGLRYEDMCAARWFKEDPRLAWGFWMHVCKTYRDSELHAGYDIVKGWMEQAAKGGYVFTSTPDGHWASCGWPVERLLERHGALHYLQCSEPCCDDTWPLPNDLGLTEDPETFRADGELPTCPKCGAVARPNVEMFGIDPAFRGNQAWEQWARYDAWAAQDLRDDGLGQPLVVCLELGCGPGSSARRFAEEQSAKLGSLARLIRVNPQHMAVGASRAGSAVAVPLRALDALLRLERIRGVAPTTNFIVQDAEGNGAEVVARSDATTGHVLRRAFAAVPAVIGEDFTVKANSILNEKEEKTQDFSQPVPASMQLVARDADLPTVRLFLLGATFSGRNARMLARLEAVKALLEELMAEYGSEQYQSKLQACEDRAMVVALVREVHYKVLPMHGISIKPEQGSGEAAKRVLAMQSFLQSGKFDFDVATGLGWSVHLSGYSRLSSLPAAKAKNIPTAGSNARAIVVADTSKQAMESKWTSSYRPPKVLWIASTWNKWSPAEMKWDGSRFVEDLTIGKTGWESFQVLVMGRWEASLYPSVRDGNPYVEYRLLGPDSKGHGRNWTIGRHARDVMRPGEKVKVIVEVDAKGAAKKVTWKREDSQGGHFKPQLTGQQLLNMEEQIVCQWQYGSKPNIYHISKTKDGLRFDGPHAGGRVSGLLQPEGLWLQANLVSSSGNLVGYIRLSYLKDDNTMISNFKNASKTEWGKDIAATRVPADK